jgi:hypothetical protein
MPHTCKSVTPFITLPEVEMNTCNEMRCGGGKGNPEKQAGVIVPSKKPVCLKERCSRGNGEIQKCSGQVTLDGMGDMG